MLCTMVAASAFDAAIHDAYGKAHGLNCYHTYGPDFLEHDLGRRGNGQPCIWRSDDLQRLAADAAGHVVLVHALRYVPPFTQPLSGSRMMTMQPVPI